MSARQPSYAGQALIDRLPQDRRNELIAIGRQALCRFGFAYQHVFDANLELFEFLAARGATATMIGRLLAEAGIVRKDGTALPAGTVSSALSRARERAAQRPDIPLHAPARAGMDMQIPAGSGSALHRRADQREAVRASSAGPALSPALLPASSQQLTAIRPMPNSSAGTELPPATRRAAALLEHLRSPEHDDDA